MKDLLGAKRAPHVKIFGGGGGVIVPREIERAPALRHHADLLARGRTAARPRGHDRRDDRRLRLRARSSSRSRTRLSTRSRPRTPRCSRRLIAACRADRRLAPRAHRRTSHRGNCRARLPRAAEATRAPGRRHHRHRRRGQVVAHRRARPPLPRRLRDKTVGDRLGRSDQAEDRRRAARRPHPHERDRFSRASTCAALATRASRLGALGRGRRTRSPCSRRRAST